MNVLQNALKKLQMNHPFGGASIGNIMYKMITLLLVVFITGCSTPRMSSSLSIKNANGNISWASGINEKVYMPDSKRTITFISDDSVSAFFGAIEDKDEPCKSYYKNSSKVTICDESDVMLFKDDQLINTGFLNLYNGY